MESNTIYLALSLIAFITAIYSMLKIASSENKELTKDL